MKLTEKQAFSLMYKIEEWLGVKVEPEERADFVMLYLINFELN